MDPEPSVINHDMLEKAIKEQSNQGEIMRLNEENPIDFNSISSIRMEFQGILKIDHLWMLQNLTKLSLNYNKIDTIENLESLTKLKELDLSFNYIERIQNLEGIKNLEVLSLFSNRIEVIENLEGLKELVILNIGANKIHSLVGFERLRFLTKLKVFNMERNPIGESMNLREYVSAYLPNLKYYDYAHITEQEKGQAAREYSRELRQLKEQEDQEIRWLCDQEQLDKEQKHHFQCFVEDLNGHQLFERLFKDQLIPDGIDRIIQVQEQLKEEMFRLTQKIYLTGLDRFEEREQEVKSFNICLTNAKRENQRKGQKIINNLITSSSSKNPLHISPQIESSWTELMEMEVHLFEDIEDITKTFGFIIADLINDFVKDVQSFFVQIKELIAKFSEKLENILHEMEREGNPAIEALLRTCASTNEFVQSLWKYQKDVLSDREFLLQERAREWTKCLLESYKEEEIERNRRKIIEINFFLDLMRGK